MGKEKGKLPGPAPGTRHPPSCLAPQLLVNAFPTEAAGAVSGQSLSRRQSRLHTQGTGSPSGSVSVPDSEQAFHLHRLCLPPDAPAGGSLTLMPISQVRKLRLREGQGLFGPGYATKWRSQSTGSAFMQTSPQMDWGGEGLHVPAHAGTGRGPPATLFSGTARKLYDGLCGFRHFQAPGVHPTGISRQAPDSLSPPPLPPPQHVA